MIVKYVFPLLDSNLSENELRNSSVNDCPEQMMSQKETLLSRR